MDPVYLARKSCHTSTITVTVPPPTSTSTFASLAAIEPDLTSADRLVLHNLLRDVVSQASTLGDSDREQVSTDDDDHDVQTIKQLSTLLDRNNRAPKQSVSSVKDNADFSPWIQISLLHPYVAWALSVVRRPSDVIFLTYILGLFAVGLPSMVLLFLHFTWYQALFQWMLVTYLIGPFSILMHNYIHGRGFMRKTWGLIDTLFPYILGPMMGQTWNSFYYHHKHHHIEDNGPNDLSSTLFYQRDSGFHLIVYLGRFVFLTWLELPIYYIRNGMLGSGLKFFAWEISSYAFIVLMAQVNFAAAMTGLVLPLIQWRIAVMANNWGQHALIDEEEPASNIRCSITLIDVVANRHGFNDGYHTSHHIIPARHWSEHPQAFIKMKQQLAEGRALTFQKLDFIKLTYLLLRKDYNYIARCIVPMGEQIGKSNEELAAMLRRKTKSFSEQTILLKYH